MINMFKRILFNLKMNQFQEVSYLNIMGEIKSNAEYIINTTHHVRGDGKTSVLLKIAHETGVPFYVSLYENVPYVESLKKKYGFNKAEILTPQSLFLMSYGSSKKVLIDEPANVDFIVNYPDIKFYGFMYDTSDEMNNLGKVKR